MCSFSSGLQQADLGRPCDAPTLAGTEQGPGEASPAGCKCSNPGLLPTTQQKVLPYVLPLLPPIAPALPTPSAS